MSTKIYNGYVLPSMTVYQLRQFIIILRKRLYPVSLRLIAEKIAEECTDNIDDITTQRILQKHYMHRFKHVGSGISKYCLERPLISNVRGKVDEKYKEIFLTKGRNPSYDFQFKICFSPLKNRTLAIIYTEQKELTKVWNKMNGVKEYGYWNNSDSPKGITDKQWKQREDDWDEALGDIGIPAHHGLEWSLLDDYFLPMHEAGEDIKNILKYVPSSDKRAQRLAKEKVMHIKMKEYRRKNNIKKTESFSDSGYFYAQDFCQTEAGGKMLLKYQDIFLKKIIPIDESALRSNYYQLVEKRIK